MISLHNWLNNLVESFTFYGARAGGGGAVGGGKPYMGQPMQQQTQPMFAGGGRPFNPQANQNTPYLTNFGDGRFPQGMPSMPQGLPPMPQGMPQSQGLPMQGGQFGNMNLSSGLPAQQPQSMPMQSNSFAGGGRPFNPQALQNNPYLMNFVGNRLPPSMGMPTQQPQDLPMQGGAFAGGIAPSIRQNQNTQYLINNKVPPNFTSQRQPMQGLMQGVPFK
jgi:hypothetical protein